MTRGELRWAGLIDTHKSLETANHYFICVQIIYCIIVIMCVCVPSVVGGCVCVYLVWWTCVCVCVCT